MRTIELNSAAAVATLPKVRKARKTKASALNLPDPEEAAQTLAELWERVRGNVLVRKRAAQTLAELWERVGCCVLVRKHAQASSAGNPPGTPNAPKAPSTSSPIPTEAERPRFVVLDEEHHASDGTRYGPGVWHFGTRPGRGDAPPTLTQHRISGPLHIEAVTFDSAGNNFGRLLRFKDTLNHWRQWAMPMEMLKGDGADLRGVLLSMGVYIDPSPNGRQMLAVYLQSQTPARQMEAATQTGWVGKGFKAFALPDNVIGPMASRVTFQAQGLYADEYTQDGTLPGWKAGVAALAAGNPMLILAISCAFAGPLMAMVNGEPGGLHLMGDSTEGKTTATEAACSVWGGKNYRRSWRATANGLEGTAALFNDGLLALDEIKECDPREVGEVVYMLGNGRGKARASRNGMARAVTRWSCCVISNGERSIGSIMESAGQQINAGQTVRLLCIRVLRKYGAFDTLHGYPSGSAFAKAIEASRLEHYGTAGRAFLEKLTRDTRDMAARLEAIKESLMASASTRPGDGQPARAADRLAVMALAGELATAYGITGWEEGEATAAAAVGFAAWLKERGDLSGSIENSQILQAVRSFIERHGDSRFSDAAGPYDEKAQRIQNRAGWWVHNGHAMEYWFTADGLREALKGFDFAAALRVLQGAGVLPPPGKDGRASKSQRIHARKERIYQIQYEKLD